MIGPQGGQRSNERGRLVGQRHLIMVNKVLFTKAHGKVLAKFVCLGVFENSKINKYIQVCSAERLVSMN